ncbi:unnamed protein product, partial [Mesorhabditis spiculigera]
MIRRVRPCCLRTYPDKKPRWYFCIERTSKRPANHDLERGCCGNDGNQDLKLTEFEKDGWDDVKARIEADKPTILLDRKDDKELTAMYIERSEKAPHRFFYPTTECCAQFRKLLPDVQENSRDHVVARDGRHWTDTDLEEYNKTVQRNYAELCSLLECLEKKSGFVGRLPHVAAHQPNPGFVERYGFVEFNGTFFTVLS